MKKVRCSIGEVRTAPNSDQYSLVSIDRAKGRAALLLIHQKNPQSFQSQVMTIAFNTWLQWRIEQGKDESLKITDEVRRAAYNLLNLL